MAKRIVVCCDGTGNEVNGNLSNVLKLYRIAKRNNEQRLYYNPGVGTIGSHDAWARFQQRAKSIFGLATGYGIDDDVLNAYRFICQNYEFSGQRTDEDTPDDQDDEIFLFGFSRGAYTVRILSGFINSIGLLQPDQLNTAGYALSAYKKAAEAKNLSLVWDFARIIRSRRVTIKFVGVWDTVASVIVPRRGVIMPTLMTLPFTRKNPSVKVFRQAMALDERRRMFRLNRWLEPQRYVANPFARVKGYPRQDVKQVWFSGVHSDVGGGYLESESGLSKYPLLWMVNEACDHGLQIDTAMARHLVLGQARQSARYDYVAPDPAGLLHNSMIGAWPALEYIPKRVKYREWQAKRSLLGHYLPLSEPRNTENGSAPVRIHQSVLDRMAQVDGYRPENLPQSYTVEPHRDLLAPS